MRRPPAIRWFRLALVLPGDAASSPVMLGRGRDGSTWVPARWIGPRERFVAEVEGWSISGPGGDYVRTATVRRHLARSDFHRAFLARVERRARDEARSRARRDARRRGDGRGDP